jgi:hypothetical protein
MAKERPARLEYHLKFNGRNPGHVSAAMVLASVDKQYKSSFIALAIGYYMESHPMGISIEELLSMYRQTERGYLPKTPIAENLQNGRPRSSPMAPPPIPARDTQEDAGTGGAIDKAMDFYDVS